MNAASTNILSLLLGIAPVKTGTGDVPVAGDAGQPSFDLLLGGLLSENAETPVNAETAPAKAGVMPPTSQLPEDLPAFAADPTRPRPGAGGATPHSDWATRLLNADPADARPIYRHMMPVESAVAAPEANAYSPITVPVAAQIESAALYGQEQSPVPTAATAPETVPSMLPQAQPGSDLWKVGSTELQQGAYKVTNYQISDGMIDLELASAETGGATIRVSLPVDQVRLSADAITTINPNVARRLDLAGGQQDNAALLTSFFDKVNLTEVRIDLGGNQPARSPLSTPAELTFVAENVGQEVAIKGSIARNQIKIKAASDGQASAKPSSAFGPAATPTSFGVRTAVAPTAPSGQLPAGSDLKEWATGYDWTALPGESDSSATASKDTGVALPDFARTANDLTITRGTTSLAPARFQLPENARTALKPNGQSVQLRIDPEHLGPARLSLTMHHDHVRATVVVQSNEARQMLEGSLDRLLDSLAKADIKVDSIDVSVDHEAAGEQLFQKRPHWAQSTRPAWFTDSEYETVDSSMLPYESGRTRGGFIGAERINVLA